MIKLKFEKCDRKGRIGAGESKDIKGRVDYADVDAGIAPPYPTVHRQSDGSVALFLGRGDKLVCLHVTEQTARYIISELSQALNQGVPNA